MTTRRRRSARRGKVKTLSVVGTAADSAASTSTLDIPAHNNGELLLVHYRVAGPPADFNLSGWTRLATAQPSTVRHSLFAKVANGVDEASVPAQGASSLRRFLWVIRGDKKIRGFSVATPGSFDGYQVTDGNPTAQIIQTSVGAYPQIAYGLFANENGAVVSPRTWSPAVTSELSSATFFYGGVKLWNVGDTPADTSIDMDDEGNNNVLASLKILVT